MLLPFQCCRTPVNPLGTCRRLREVLSILFRFDLGLIFCHLCLAQRAKLFKAGVGRDEARRGRSETQVQIRKEKKEERLNQRRRKGSAGDALGAFTFGSIPEGGAPAAAIAGSGDQATHMRVCTSPFSPLSLHPWICSRRKVASCLSRTLLLVC